MSETAEKAGSLIREGMVSDAIQLLENEQDDPACAARYREYLVGEGMYETAAGLSQRLAVGKGAEALVSRSFLAMLRGDLKTALEACQQALAIDSRLATVHNHFGRALHNAGHPDQSIQAFRTAASLQGEYPEAWHNLGHVYRAVGRYAESEESYRKAIEQAPAYRSARLNLGKLLFNLDRVAEALELFNNILDGNPEDVEALTDAGLALQLLGRPGEALAYYERVLSLTDSNVQVYVNRAILLNEQQDAEAAAGSLRRALALDPNCIEALIELAATHEMLNQLPEAGDLVEKGLQLAPGNPALLLQAAKLERRQRNTEKASRYLESIVPDELPGRLKRPYYFELGAVLDAEGSIDAAYEAFRAGNRLAAQDPRRQQLSGERYLQNCDRLADWAGQGAPGSQPGTGATAEDTGADLCFLHGFTRSGTTLLDMMLEVHPGIRVLEEVPTLEQVITRLHKDPGGYPWCLGDLQEDQLPALRRIYREAVAATGPDDGSTVILDKMPMRFIHSGLINRLFPDAKILFALRHPCDVVLSNFMQQYPSTSDFLVNFDTLHDAAVVYDRTFGVWELLRPHLTLSIESLRYEDLVADPAQEMERICNFLGVEMDAAMLETESRIAVRERVITPSYQQVGEAVNRRAVDRWRRYERYIAPEFQLVSRHVFAHGYSI